MQCHLCSCAKNVWGGACLCDRTTALCSLRAAEKTEESVSLLEKVLGHTDAHAAEVKARAKVRAERVV